MEQSTRNHYTIADYMALEQATNTKYEYYNGEVVALAGGSFDHALIGKNLTTLLDVELENNGKECLAFNSDTKVYLKGYQAFVYPDAGVVCGKEEYADNHKEAITNPLLIIEVLSDSTANYDRGSKFQKYRSLPSLKEYLLVHQDKAAVETYYKGDNGLWTIGPVFTGLATAIPIHCLGFSLPMKRIYRNIRQLKNSQGKLEF